MFAGANAGLYVFMSASKAYRGHGARKKQGVGQWDEFKLVGSSYMNGLMTGEMFGAPSRREFNYRVANLRRRRLQSSSKSPKSHTKI